MEGGETGSDSKAIIVAFDWYDHRVYQGIAQYCTENDWHLSSYFFSDRQIPKNWSGDGAITCFGDALSDFIVNLDMPKVDVSLRDDVPIDIPRVVVDNEQIGRRAAKHFLQRGFREFAFFSGENVAFNQIRKESFFQVLSDAGVLDDSMHEIVQPTDDIIRDWRAHIDCLVEQIDKLPRPLAVFTGQDNLGVTLVEACVKAGISVPNEVAVLGVGNTDFLCDCSVVPLSSIDTNLVDLGYYAAEQLGKLMSGEVSNQEPVRKVPVGDVIKRRSSDALAVSHPEVAKALLLMRSEFTRGLVLEDIYEYVGLSKRGLEKAFSKHLNNSPAAVLRQIRLDYAKRRLTQSDDKIEAIALECGYSNSSNLSHAFNREIGMSPQQYRNEYRSSLYRVRLK